MKHRFIRFFLLILVPCLLYADQADLIIFSYDRPLQLWALLESLEKNVNNIGDVSVVYRASSQLFEQGYEEVKKEFDGVEYLQQSSDPTSDFKSLTMQCLHNGIHDYVLFAVDDIVVTGSIDLDDCIQELEITNAYGFYLRMGLNLNSCYSQRATQKKPHGAIHKDDFFVWKFSAGQCDWNYPHSVDMTIFRKKMVIQQIERLAFTSPNVLESHWAGRAVHTRDKFGICYVRSRIVNLPLNRVQNDIANRNMGFLSPQELLSLFAAGLKMDIEPLQGFVNEAAHMEYIPTFVLRDPQE